MNLNTWLVRNKGKKIRIKKSVHDHEGFEQVLECWWISLKHVVVFFFTVSPYRNCKSKILSDVVNSQGSQWYIFCPSITPPSCQTLFIYAPVSNLIFTLIGSIYSTAVCEPDCVNGVCVGPQICSCEPGFHGYRCENGMLGIKDCRVGGLCCVLILLLVVVCSKPLSFNNQSLLMTEKSNCMYHPYCRSMRHSMYTWKLYWSQQLYMPCRLLWSTMWSRFVRFKVLKMSGKLYRAYGVGSSHLAPSKDNPTVLHIRLSSIDKAKVGLWL